jgi:hypothetical protein
VKKILEGKNGISHGISIGVVHGKIEQVLSSECTERV